MTAIPQEQALARLAPLAGELRASLGDAAERAWLVGGVVRDALLERDLPDVDVVVDADPERAARGLAKSSGGSPFPLSHQYGCWRVAQADGRHTDLCPLRGGSLAADLQLRDFTINAMAVPVAAPDTIEDPLGGIDDLVAGLVRMVSAASLDDDPLRLLRAARIAHLLGLELDQQTEQAIRQRARHAIEPSGERVFAELCLLVEAPEARRAIRLLDRLGLVEHLLPELHRCRGIGQSRYHHLDVYEHTLAVLDNCEDVLADPAHYLPPPPDAAVPDPPLDALGARVVRFAALAHDLGKPDTRRERDGRVSFLHHDQAGIAIVDAMSDRWAVSNDFRESVKLLVRTHLAIGMLLHGPLGPRERYRFLRSVEPRAAEAIILSLADRFATAGPEDRRKWVRRHHALCVELWHQHWRERAAGRPEPLLDGRQIAELCGLEPGPAIGRVVRALAEEQAVGAVTTPEQARSFVLQASAQQ